MSYEPTEDRIERLEHQVASLIQIVKDLLDFAVLSKDANLKLSAVLLEGIVKNGQSNLVSLKFTIENSSGFDAPLKAAALAMIEEKLKEFAVHPSAVAELEKLEAPIFPDDLLPPLNPSGRP
jgi:hypothetical protein